MTDTVPLSDTLRSLAGTPERAALLDSSPRSRVWRVDVRGGGRVIVKQTVEGNGGGVAADARQRPVRKRGWNSDSPAAS
ncbi:hypothetical protein ACWD0Y_29595, partial [Streptomyces altiplanensis]